MRLLATIILLLIAASPGQAAETVNKDDWFRDDLSSEERNELVEAAKKEKLEKIAPTVLKVLVQYQPFFAFGLGPSGDTPWNDKRLSARNKTYLMASAVWQHHMSPGDDLPTAKVVLSLLQKASLPAEKSLLITAISRRQWCPDAEPTLLDLSRDAEEPLGIRRLAAEALLDRCDINTYMPLAVEIILAHEKGLPRCQAFNFTTNQGNRLFTLSDKNRNAVLTAGFGILSDFPDEEMQVGYFVARRLGYILKIENTFVPDQQAARYQGKTGLKDEFFIDTVKNAIAWHSKHKSEIESN